MSESLKAFRHQTMDGGNARVQVAVGGVGPPLVFIHGFPQTWWEWRRMLPGLAKTNTVVAVDLRGAGHSDCPQEGYDKATMAADVHGVMLALGFERYAVCGHDVGARVALALAVAYRGAVTRLAVLDASQPGSGAWEANCAKPGLWRLAFHPKRNLPERPPYGRKYDYVSTFTFIADHAFGPDAHTVEDLPVFAGDLARPGNTRGGLEWTRAFPNDHRNAQTRKRERLAIPVLALGGDHNYGPTILALLEAFAETVSGGGIADCAHWLPEERPAETADALVEFLK
uniref:Alpha/beta hydrolase fold n=1 Tax=Caulobacter sp. (strain K31) TaxID=366602 RepID=B0T6Q0_CAUSK